MANNQRYATVRIDVMIERENSVLNRNFVHFCPSFRMQTLSDPSVIVKVAAFKASRTLDELGRQIYVIYSFAAKLISIQIFAEAWDKSYVKYLLSNWV